MNGKTFLISILPIFSISSGIILNHYLSNRIQKNAIFNKKNNNNIKKKLKSNKEILNDKLKNTSFIKHKSINASNINNSNLKNNLQHKNVSVVLNRSFNKNLVFAPYIYHFYYKQYEENKNGIYQLVSHDAKIWTHYKIVHVAYPFLNSTYVKIIGVKGNKNNLQINQNFKLSANELRNVSKNTLKINIDAIGVVSNPHIYFDYHYKLKGTSKTILNNKKHNLKKYIIKENTDDCFDQNLTNLKPHFNNYQIKMFGYYKVFNLNLSAKSWFTHNLINALLMLLPIVIDIFANMFCGIVSGLIMGSITSQIKNFIISFNLNLIDSTLTKGYLGYAYMAGNTLFAMGESEMEFIASGVGDFFVTSKSIHGMSKTFSDEQSKTEVIEYAGDDDMREKLDDSDNASVSTNQSFSYSHNASEQENNNIQPPLDNQAQNSHSNMNVATQVSDRDENLSLILLGNNSNILVNNNDAEPVVVEENNYGEYNTQLASNNHSYRIIQEDPNRGIGDSDSSSDEENDNDEIKSFSSLQEEGLIEQEQIEEITSDEDAIIAVPFNAQKEHRKEVQRQGIIKKEQIQLRNIRIMMDRAFLMPYVFEPHCNYLHLIDIETGFRAKNIEEVMRLKRRPNLLDRIRYFEQVLSKIGTSSFLQDYSFPNEINYEELALKQITNEDNGIINFFGIPFSEATIQFTKEELFKPWKDFSLIDYLLSKDVFKFDFQKFVQLSSLDYMEKHVNYSEAKLFLYRVKKTNISIYFDWLKTFDNEEKIIELLLHPDYEIKRQLFFPLKENYSSKKEAIPTDLHIIDMDKFEFMSLNYFYYLIITYGDYSLEFYNSLCYAKQEFQNAHSNFTFMDIFREHLDTVFIHECGNLKFEDLKIFNANLTLKGKIEHLKESKPEIVIENDFETQIDYDTLALRQLLEETSDLPIRYHVLLEAIVEHEFSQSIIKYTNLALLKSFKDNSLIDYLLTEGEFDIIKFAKSSSLEYMKQYIEYSKAKLFLSRIKKTSMNYDYLNLIKDFGDEQKVIEILLHSKYEVRREIVCGPSLSCPGTRKKIWDDSRLTTKELKFDFDCGYLEVTHYFYLAIAYKNYDLNFLNSFILSRMHEI